MLECGSLSKEIKQNVGKHFSGSYKVGGINLINYSLVILNRGIF